MGWAGRGEGRWTCGAPSPDHLVQIIDAVTRSAIACVSNMICVLAQHFVLITDTILIEVYEWAMDQECDMWDLLHDEMAKAHCHHD